MHFKFPVYCSGTWDTSTFLSDHREDFRPQKGGCSLQDDLCQAVSDPGLSPSQSLCCRTRPRAPDATWSQEASVPTRNSSQVWQYGEGCTLEPSLPPLSLNWGPEAIYHSGHWTEVLDHSWQVASPLCLDEFYSSYIHQAVAAVLISYLYAICENRRKDALEKSIPGCGFQHPKLWLRTNWSNNDQEPKNTTDSTPKPLSNMKISSWKNPEFPLHKHFFDHYILSLRWD